jgi:hypothetical protein
LAVAVGLQQQRAFVVVDDVDAYVVLLQNSFHLTVVDDDGEDGLFICL